MQKIGFQNFKKGTPQYKRVKRHPKYRKMLF
jgi:hypothetical protein